MKFLLKHLWFLFTLVSTLTAWGFSTLIMINEIPSFIHNQDDLFLTALLLPAVVFLMGNHLMRMATSNWLTKDK